MKHQHDVGLFLDLAAVAQIIHRGSLVGCLLEKARHLAPEHNRDPDLLGDILHRLHLQSDQLGRGVAAMVRERHLLEIVDHRQLAAPLGVQPHDVRGDPLCRPSRAVDERDIAMPVVDVGQRVNNLLAGVAFPQSPRVDAAAARYTAI